MNLSDPLFPRDSEPGTSISREGADLLGLDDSVSLFNVAPGIERDLAQIEKLGNFPDLYDATYLVDSVVECLQFTTVGELAINKNISRIIGDLSQFTNQESVFQIRSALENNSRGDLARSLDQFVKACADLISKLEETRQQVETDPLQRFMILQPAINVIIEGRQDFYTTFAQA